MLLLIEFLSLTVALEYIPELCLEGEQPLYSTKRRKDKHTCQKCQPGWVAPENGICQKCLSGRYQDLSGQGICLGDICQPGYYGTLGNTKIEKTSCTKCQPGQYSLKEGQDSCNECPPGKWSNLSSSTQCYGTVCPKGNYGPLGQTSKRPCILCPMSKYNLESGSTSCLLCPENTWRNFSSPDQYCYKVKCPHNKYPNPVQDGSCLIWYKNNYYRNNYIANCCATGFAILLLIRSYKVLTGVYVIRFILLYSIILSLYNYYLTDLSPLVLITIFNMMGVILLWCDLMDKLNKLSRNEP